MLAAQVSNRNMRGRLVVTVLLLTTSLSAQTSHPGPDARIVERAKKTIISSFDALLPNLTLESFLQYETENSPIEWQASECKQEVANRNASRKLGKTICVRASADLRDERVVSVVVSLGVDDSAPPNLISVSVIEKGLEHPLKLIQLPAAIHGGKFRTRSPRDLLPLSTAG